MPILHAHNEPQFTEHLGSVLTEANDQFHSVNIAVVYSTSPAPLGSPVCWHRGPGGGVKEIVLNRLGSLTGTPPNEKFAIRYT